MAQLAALRGRVLDESGSGVPGAIVRITRTGAPPQSATATPEGDYSFTDLQDQLTRLNHYTTLAARQMHESGRRAGIIDLAVHPPAAFLRNYVLRRGFLEGTTGFIISVTAAYSVFLKFAKLRELYRTSAATPKT